MNSELAGRPDIMGKRKSLTLVPGMTRLTEGSVLNVKNKSYNVTADIVVPDGGADGVILVQGGAFGGWVVYLRDGHLKYCYNLLGVTRFYAESADPVPAGEHQVRMEFAYDGDGIAKGGDVTLYVDEKVSALVGSIGRCRSSSPPTTAWMSVLTQDSASPMTNPKAASPAPSSGFSSILASKTTNISSLSRTAIKPR